MFQAGGTVVTRLVWRGTHTGPYGGTEATGKPVEVRDMAIWHLADGKVAEIWTLQDHFGLRRRRPGRASRQARCPGWLR